MEDFVVFKKKDLEDLLKQVATEALAEIKPEKPKNVGVGDALDYLKDLGYTMSRSTLYKHTMAGTIPFYRFGERKIIFNVDELDEWVAGRITGKTENSVMRAVARSARRKINN